MAEIRMIRTASEQGLAAAWEQQKGELPGLPGLRADAFRQFQTQGLPHRRVEEWKYTDLRALMRDAKPLASPPGVEARTAARSLMTPLPGVNARELVLVDGAFLPELSDTTDLDPGLEITSLRDALTRGDPILDQLGRAVPSDDVAYALNTAFMSDGAVIRVAAGARIERPLRIAHVYSDATASALFVRSLLVLEPGAYLTLIETHDGPPGLDYQANLALDVFVGDDAHFDHVKLNLEGGHALHLSTMAACIGARAKVHDLAFTLGSAVTRHQVFARLIGSDTKAAFHGVSMLRGRQHVDTTLVLDHATGGCESRELFKAVLDEESRGVFQGKIIVRPQAQKTDGKMMTRALLLSDRAEANSKPELEIFADDVQCGHGATAGSLDEDLLFYLRARGIPAKEAESLLIQSFVGQALESVENDALRELLLEQVANWLRERAQALVL